MARSCRAGGVNKSIKLSEFATWTPRRARARARARTRIHLHPSHRYDSREAGTTTTRMRYGQKLMARNGGEMTAAGHEGEAAAGQAGEPLVSSSQWPNPRAPQWPVSPSSISPRPGVDLVAVIVRAFSNFPAGPGEAGSSASWGPLSSVRQEEQQQQPASAINLARSNKWTKHSKEYYLCFFFSRKSRVFIQQK